jgi:hypothetical protein
MFLFLELLILRFIIHFIQINNSRRKKMKKKLFYSAAAIGLSTVLTIPLMGFSSVAPGPTKVKPNQITVESGGTSIPYKTMGEQGLYHQPTDGIISGTAGCQPDIHEFDKSEKATNPYTGEVEPGHIVFTAGIKEIADVEQANSFVEKGANIYVEITSNGQKVLELPFTTHEPDSNTNEPFWVSTVYLNGAVPGGESDGRTSIDLPTGEYNYQFKAKDKNGHVLDVWVPKNHKFTITE